MFASSARLVRDAGLQKKSASCPPLRAGGTASTQAWQPWGSGSISTGSYLARVRVRVRVRVRARVRVRVRVRITVRVRVRVGLGLGLGLA